ncbi:MAG: hypothetical protein CK424_01085 [Legionella sp.]|nr:MAG: hypothetical protein CK424_01085 [Legionella sp.]
MLTPVKGSPSKGDGTTLGLDFIAIFKQLSSDDWRLSLPRYANYKSQMLQVEGSLPTIYAGLLVASISAYPAMSLSGAVANKLTSVPHFFRFALASSSVLLGGYLRIWGANKVDRGEGKQAILTLLAISIIGISGLGLSLPNDDILAILTIHDEQFWILGLCCLLAGAALAAYSPCMALSAKWAPADSVQFWSDNRKRLADKLGKPAIGQLDTIERSLAFLLRQNAPGYMATIGGLGNITPAFTLLLLSGMVPSIGLKNTCASFLLLYATAFVAIYYLIQDSPYDQLIKLNVSPKHANELACFMGQKSQPSSTEPYWSRIQQLSVRDKLALLLICTNYITTLGTLFTIASGGAVTFTLRGLAPDEATKILGYLVGLDAIVRTLIPMLRVSVHADVLSNYAFLGMTVSSCAAAISPHQSIWLPALFVFSIFNGIGNSSVVTQISEHLSADISLATGLSSGAGAFSSFFISLLAGKMATYNQLDTGYEYFTITLLAVISLSANTAFIYSKRSDSPAVSTQDSDEDFSFSMVETPSETTSLTMSSAVDDLQMSLAVPSSIYTPLKNTSKMGGEYGALLQIEEPLSRYESFQPKTLWCSTP